MRKPGLILVFVFMLLAVRAQKTELNAIALDKLETRVIQNTDSCQNILNKSILRDVSIFPRLIYLKANCFLYSNNFDSAVLYFAKAEPLLLGDNKRLAFIRYGLGFISYAKGDKTKAKSFYKQAEKWNKGMTDNLFNSLLYSELGTVYFDLNISDSSLLYYSLALANAKQLGDKARIASGCNNISIAFYKTGDYEKAIEWQIEAIKIKEQLGDTLSLATSLNNVGSFFIKLKKFGDANRYLSRSFKMMKSENKIAGFSALNLGVCFKMTGQYDSAIYYDTKALGIYKKLGLESNIGKVYSNLGGVYEAQGNLPKAIEFMLKALEVSKKLKNDYETALRNRNVANVYLLMNKPKQAKPFIFEAQNLATALHSVELSMEVSNIMSKYYEKVGMPELALKFFKEYKKHNDSLHTESSQKTISELNAKYETEKKEKEILNLKNLRRISDLEMTQKENALFQQKLILLFTILTIILISLMLFLWFKRYRLKQYNAQQLIARQKTELEQRMLLSQMNPHFIFNSLASVQEYIGSNEQLKAQKFLSSFAKLMRSILENSLRQFIPLDEEIVSIQLYLDLEKQRFNNRFEYSIENKVEDPEFVLVPPMLVQPFVENAILHGFANRDIAGKIDIEYVQVGNLIQIIIQDNGVGRNKPKDLNQPAEKRHNSVGTIIVKDRIELLNNEYGCNASVSYQDLKSEDGSASGTRVVLTIPFNERKD